MGKKVRKYPELAACGLKCGLCLRYHTDGTSKCPGCGGEGFFEKRPSCGKISCTERHDIENCYLCDKFPCNKYDGVGEFDSFITYRNLLKDSEKIKEIGLDAFQVELHEKIKILEDLIENYNDGRRKSFYCLAVNLLELDDLKEIMSRISEINPDTEIKEKAKQTEQVFKLKADKNGVVLKLNKKKD